MTPRPFCMFVDSGNREEPEPRYFGSLAAAKLAAEALDPKWWAFVWITERPAEGRPITHMNDGRAHSDE